MKKNTKILTILIILILSTLLSGCIDGKHNTYDNPNTYYNENDKENYFTLYPFDASFVYIELKKDGSQTFDLSKAGTYKIDNYNIFLIAPQGIVLRGKIIDKNIIIDSEGTKWIEK